MNALVHSVYGEAYLLVDRASGKKIVVKHVCLDGLDEEDVKTAVNEVTALTSLAHPNIVQCRGAFVMPASKDLELRPWSFGTEKLRLPISEAMAVWSAAQKDEILWGLKEMHERWSGVELEPVIAYGLRVYVGFIVFEEVCRG